MNTQKIMDALASVGEIKEVQEIKHF